MRLRDVITFVIRTATGLQLRKIGPRSILVFDPGTEEIEVVGAHSTLVKNKNHIEDAWFSQKSQVHYLLQKHNVNLVIDAGANVGQFAQDLRTIYSGDIISFEPVAATFDVLNATASKDEHWRVLNIALGSKESRQAINVCENSLFSSMLGANNYGHRQFSDQINVRGQESVVMRRLDDVLLECCPHLENVRIFLKMDTQGFDLEVFEGARTSIGHVVVLQSEVSVIPIYEHMPHWTQNISTYEQEGFGIVGFYPVIRDAQRVIEFDCLMSR